MYYWQGRLIIFNEDADLPVYVSGVGEDGQGGRDVDGDDDPCSGEDVLAVGGGGGQSGHGHWSVSKKYFIIIYLQIFFIFYLSTAVAVRLRVEM